MVFQLSLDSMGTLNREISCKKRNSKKDSKPCAERLHMRQYWLILHLHTGGLQEMKEVEQLQAKGRMTLGVKEGRFMFSHLEKVDLSKSLALYKCERRSLSAARD